MPNLKIEYINPDNMVKPRGYSHAVSVSGDNKTIYIGGQNAIDENGNIVGRGDLKIQTQQVLANIEKILKTSGATLENIVKWNAYIVQGQNPQAGFEIFQKKWGTRQNFPAITVLFVSELARPEWLMEMDVIAVVPLVEPLNKSQN